MPVAKKAQAIYLMIISQLKAKFGNSHLFLISRFNIVLNWNEMVFYDFSDALDKMRIDSIERAGIEKVGYFYLP